MYRHEKYTSGTELTYEQWLEKSFIELLKKYDEIVKKDYKPSPEEIQKMSSITGEPAELCEEALLSSYGDIKEACLYIVQKKR